MSAKAKIRHIALRTSNPEELSSFYEKTFGFMIVGRTPGGAIYMSDGYLTLAILRNRGDYTPSGINHFGFQVDDMDEIEKRLQAFDEPLTGRPSTRPYAERRAMDPDGNLFDVSVHGYDKVEYGDERESKQKLEKAPA